MTVHIATPLQTKHIWGLEACFSSIFIVVEVIFDGLHEVIPDI